MEFGYKNPMKFIIQTRDRDGEVNHHLLEAGSEKDAERKMRNQLDSHEMKIVTNIKSNGELGGMGHGQLHNEDHNIKEIHEELTE